MSGESLTTGNSCPKTPGREFTAVELEQLRFSIERYIDTRDLKCAINPRVELEKRLTLAADQLVLRLEQVVFGRTASVTIRHPATWWDHLKQALGWRYKERVHIVDGALLFPDINVPGQKAVCLVRKSVHYGQAVS